MAKDRQAEELEFFHQVWDGGFYSGSPLDPFYSKYNNYSYIGLYHAIYLACIKPYVHADANCLEIGCGRGAWTRTMLAARTVTCLDALSAEHNKFWEYLGPRDNVVYHQVEDFQCSALEANSIDYVFSYDALCHVSFEGVTEYMRSLRSKLKPGAHCFLMVADFEKYNRFVREMDKHDVLDKLMRQVQGPRVKRTLIRLLLEYVSRGLKKQLSLEELTIPEGDEANDFRWWHAGTERTASMLGDLGYEIVEKDMNIEPRSPIVHFRKANG